MRNEPQPSVVTQCTPEGVTRAFIWFPVHCLAYDNYTVSLIKNYGRCSLPRAPPTSLVGLHQNDEISESMASVDPDTKSDLVEKKFHVVHTFRPVRPEPITVAIGTQTPQEVKISGPGIRRALRHISLPLPIESHLQSSNTEPK